MKTLSKTCNNGKRVYPLMLATLFLSVFLFMGCNSSDDSSATDSTTSASTDATSGATTTTSSSTTTSSTVTSVVDGDFSISATMSDVIPTVATVTWSISDVDSLDSAYIEFGPDEDFGFEATTDVTDSGTYETFLVGMKPSSTYYYQIAAIVDDVEYVSDVHTLETGDAPSSLPTLSTTTYDASNHQSGFYVTSFFSSSPGAVIIDEDGDYVWWYRLGSSNLQISRAQMTPDHEWVYMWGVNVNNPSGSSSQRIVKVKIDGSETDEIYLPYGHHDFTILPDGTIAYIEYDNRTVGSTSVAGDRIVEIDPDGSNETEIYSVWDDFSYSGGSSSSGEGWCHANALDYDEDEDVYYMGSKSFSSILKIDRATKSLIYVFGGDESDFTVSTGGTQPYYGQHQFQMEDGNFLVFDNGSKSRKYSRAVEYAVDEDTMTLTLDWSYAPSSSLYNMSLGDVQFLTNTNRLVTFSTSGQIDEVDSNGDLIWRLNTSLGGAFGYVTWMESLYE